MNEKFKQCIDLWFENIKNQKPNNLTKILESDFQSVESVLEQSKWFSESGYQVLVGILEQAELGTYTVENVRATCSYIRKKHGIARTVAPVTVSAAVTRKVDMSRAVGVSVSSPVVKPVPKAVDLAQSQPVQMATPESVASGVLPAPSSMDTLNWLEAKRRLSLEKAQGFKQGICPEDVALYIHFYTLFIDNKLNHVTEFNKIEKSINNEDWEILNNLKSKLLLNNIHFGR